MDKIKKIKKTCWLRGKHHFREKSFYLLFHWLIAFGHGGNFIEFRFRRHSMKTNRKKVDKCSYRFPCSTVEPSFYLHLQFIFCYILIFGGFCQSFFLNSSCYFQWIFLKRNSFWSDIREKKKNVNWFICQFYDFLIISETAFHAITDS